MKGGDGKAGEAAGMWRVAPCDGTMRGCCELSGLTKRGVAVVAALWVHIRAN